MGDVNPIHTLRDYSKPSHKGYMNTIELPERNNVVPLRFDTIRLVQNKSSCPRLRSEDPNQHLKDFFKLVDSLDLDGANRERTCLCLFQFSLRDQASNWLERLLAGSISTWEDLTTLNKITSSCEICSGPHDTQYCMENLEQAFVEYASLCIDETGRRVKGLKVFVGSFTYKCDFVMLEDTTSVIDHDLGSVIFGKTFVDAIGLVYDMREETIAFEKDKEKIVFKMPHKMEMFKHIDFTDIKTDRIPPFVIESDDDNNEKTHYSNSLDLGPEYKYDENVCRAIRSLIAMKAKRNK
nr:MAK10-like protein [Tanacetum cinerariifolium]